MASTRDADKGPLVYLVACEPSADLLGASLMRALVAETGGKVRFAGVGGPRMTEAGLASLFDPEELALLGIFEVVPALRRVLTRVAQTLAHIEATAPDGLVTIDSWGFTGRIHQRLTAAGSRLPRIRYVAPQVWAWRPGRARQLARWIHHLMALLPFEPDYFTRYGLPATWVGHPVVESGAGHGDGAAFRSRYGIAADIPVLAVLPGSRRAEVTRLLPVFGETLSRLKARQGPFAAVVPTVAAVAAEVRAVAASWTVPVTVVGNDEIYDVFAASRAAIAASGTVSLELAAAGVPHAIAYRVSRSSAMAFRLLRRSRYVNLVNVLLDRSAVPELLQEKCHADRIVAAMLPLINDEEARQKQKTAFGAAIAQLSPAGQSPSHLAAQTVLRIVGPSG